MTREERQEYYAQLAFEAKRGILLLAMRFGKCRVGVRLLEKLAPDAKILIVYPTNTIQQSWQNEFELMQYNNPFVTFTSTRSLNKYVKEKWDWIIFDEIHDYSEAQIGSVKLLEAHCCSTALTGTLSKDSERGLKIALKWPIIATYSQEEAIRDGAVTDYRINIVQVPLNNHHQIQYKKKLKTEKQQFDAYSFIIKKLQYEGKSTMFLALGRMRLIQGSIAKLEATRRLLEEFKNERVLVFCGLIKIAEQLGIPVHHSKSDDNLTGFVEGRGDKVAVIKIGAVGRTYKPLNKVIINYFSSNPEDLQQRINRATSLEYDNPDKIAEIYIICTNEPVEKGWLVRALESFPKEKVKYI